VAIFYLPIVDPKNKRSKVKAYWKGAIGGLQDHGYRVMYTGGSGRSSGAAVAMVCGGVKELRYEGTTATESDAERAAIGLACRGEGSMILILTNCQATLQGVLNISRGAPPRSGMELGIKKGLTKRACGDIAISWIRSHIGIVVNEEANKLAAFATILGEISLSQEAGTEGGMRQRPKAIRASWRQNPGLGRRRTELHRHALAGFT